MKIGACISGNYENLLIAKNAGFDYVESNCQEIVKMDDVTFNKFKNAGIPILSANCFVGMKVTGPEKNYEKIKNYLEKLFYRAEILNIKYLVFGSSGARKRDDLTIPVETAREEIVYFLKELVAPLAEKTGIIVPIEPLRKEECNVINTIAHGIDIAKRTGSDNIKVLADVKHMLASDDPLSVIPVYKDWIVHAHTSNPYPAPELNKKRIYPKETDEFNQDLFFNPLIEAGIETCTIEADILDFKTDCKDAINLLSKYR